MSDIEETLGQLQQMGIESALAVLSHEREIRHLVSERLVTRGPAIIAPVKNMMDSSLDLDLQINCALMLFHLGNTDGIPYLLRAIKERTDWMCLAASKLAHAQFQEVAPYIIEQLRTLPMERTDELITLLLALRTIGSEIPKDIQDRFTAGTAPWQIRTLFDR
jgi:hypothetical protein